MKKKLMFLMLILSIMSCSTKKDRQIEIAKQQMEELGEEPSLEEIKSIYYNGRTYFNSNPEMAKIYFEKIVKYEPEAAKYLTMYYYKKKDFENFIKWSKYGAEKGINDATFNLAHYYQEKGNIEEATKYYLMAAKNGDKGARGNLVIMYHKLGDDEKTKKILKELGDDEKDFPLSKASFYQDQGKIEEAIQIYKDMIKAGNYDGYMGWGGLLKDIGKREEALKIYKEGVSKGSINTAFSLGVFYLEDKNYVEAEKSFIIASKDNDKSATYGVGESLEKQGKYKEALKWYEKSVELGLKEARRKVYEVKNKYGVE